MIHCRMKSVITLLIFFGNVHSIVLRSRQTISLSAQLGWNSNSPQCSPSRCKTRIYGAKSDSGESTSSNSDLQTTVSQDNWELLEDWSLQDKVPEFTIQSSSTKSTTTFWRQLRHTTPELSKRAEQELKDRYKTLAEAEPATRKEQKDAVPFITSGESPEVLNDWWMDVVEKKSSAIMMMHGRLSSGSNIWFPLQTAGTIGSDSDTTTNNGFSWLLQEGDFIKYVESSAGCIYELGNQKQGSMTNLFDTENNNNTKESNNVLALDQLSSSKTSMGVTFSAVVASSLLSAALAFTAGQASLPPPPPTPTVTSSAIVYRNPQAITPAITGSGMKYERSLNRDGTTKIVEMSIGEQRASQELKLYRDERRLTNLQDKLVSDEILLKELTATEAKLGPEEASKQLVDGMPRSPKELSISEQRARAELKIGSDKRRIVKLKEALEKDKIKLKELQTQEKQQKGFFR